MKISSVGFFGGLLIVFSALKICGIVNWSWCLVTSPLWGSALLALVLSYILALFSK